MVLSMETGVLSVVATPIGNMEDITLRALRVLGDADYVLCEDTRVTGKLLKHHGIEATPKRYDAHASVSVHEAIIEDLQGGKHIALVSDAGTPGVSDPGVLLVARVLHETSDVRVETIPGPSAVTAAFSIAGISGNQFTFLGFVPHKKGRHTFFARVAESELPVIFYESPHRIMKTLQALVDADVGKTVSIARELTKLHEEVVQGSAAEVLAYFEANSDKVRGEFVVLIGDTV